MKRKITIASLIGAIAILCIACVGIFTNNHTQSDIDPNNIVVESNNASGISLTSRTRKMAMSDNMVTTTTITATVGPEVAADKTLSWSIAWNGESTETLSNYVTMTVSEDTLSVDINYVKQFNTQIKVTATSNLSTSVSAECLIDCYQRTEAVYINGNSITNYYHTGLSYEDIFVNKEMISFNITSKKSGTITTRTDYTYPNLALTTTVAQRLQAAGFTVSNSSQEYNSDDKLTWLGLIESWIGQSYDSLSASQKSALLNALDPETGSTSAWITLYYTANDHAYDEVNTLVGKFSGSITVTGFDLSDGLTVESVTLSHEEIIF